jgi:hypothetical protein
MRMGGRFSSDPGSVPAGLYRRFFRFRQAQTYQTVAGTAKMPAMTRTRSAGSVLFLALIAVPLCGIGCDDKARQFEAGGDAGTGATAGEGGDSAQPPQGATNSGGSAGNNPTAGTGGANTVPNEGGSGGGEGSGETDWSCIEQDLEGTVSGTTADAGNDFSASCGTGNSPDVAFRFVAPAAGYYSFDTLGSSFDTVLSLFASCTGRQLACNQDTAGVPQSEVVASLEKDQEVLVVVDGSVGDQGQYSLKVEPVSCPALDLTGQPFPVSLSTVGQEDNFQATCGATPADGRLERTMRWVPETDGLYRFSVTSSIFQPTLSVFEGGKCGGQLLQCSYNVSSGHPAEVTRRLEAGEPVTLIVDATTGEPGAFSLDVKELADACPVLPTLIDGVTGVTLDDGEGTNLLSPSCSWAGNQYNGADQPFEEHIYPINIPATGFTNCTYALENMTGTWVAYLLRGNDCGGEELGCFSYNGGDDEASFSFSTEDAGDYLLVIENAAAFPGMSVTYDVTKLCY